MKKLITIILVLALILPAAALAERDPIVGYWYMYVDGNAYPELAANFGDYDSILSMFYFAEDGTVMILENAMKDGAATPRFANQGKWEKNLFAYSFNIIGFGDGKITVKDDRIEFAPSSYNGVKIPLLKIVTFNPYKDYIY